MIDYFKTFTCGQCFRWNEESDHSFTGVVNGKIYNLIDEKAYPKELHSYLDMDFDYDKVNSFLSLRDEVIKEAIKVGDGIHILKQDFYETLISFLISQNNNIPRIKGCIEKLSECFGEYIGTYDGPNNEHIGKKYYSFPNPEKIASLTVNDLAPVRLGYRAPYLIESSKQYLENSKRPLEDYLGVGPKVANCVDLFGNHNLDSFPNDVWVKRVMHQLYDIDEEDKKTMERFSIDHFSPYGGIAQQYLFFYIRVINNI